VTKRIAMAVVFAVLVAGIPIEAAAKKAKGVVTATVNGKRIKFTRYVQISGGGSTIAFMVLAQGRKGAILRTIGVACGVFPPVSVPGPGDFCTSNYQEQRIGRHPTAKAWTAQVGTIQVTFDSYDGTQIAGHFSGTLGSISGDPPVTIDAQFRGRVTLAR
jgi:hypothetical protein